MSAVQQQLCALREAGAARSDPVHWHYLETLAQRAQTQPPQVQALLHARLLKLLARLQQKLALTSSPGPTSDPSGGVVTGPASSTALGELNRYLQQQAALHEGEGEGEGEAAPLQPPQQQLAQAAGAPRELKSVRQSRSTWSRLSADKQLNQALDLAPKNAGPINSHMVVLRSLRLMRDISPDYLNRFVSYVDTLLCLEQAESERPAAARAAAAGGVPKKTRVRKAG
jgi:hypothetical protein